MGNWSEPSRWSSAAFPNNGAMTYDAIINGGTVSLDQNIEIEALTLSGGTIDGPSDLELNAASVWSGGNMGGSGTTTFNALLTITGNVNLQGTRTLNNEGSATFNGTSGHFINNLIGTTINNLSGATFTIDGNNDFVGTGTFNNAGTFHKSAGAMGDGVTSFSGAFNNADVVNVTSGELSLRGGGTQSGSFNVAADGILGFAIGAFEINVGTTIAGNGMTHFASNSVKFNTVTFDIDTLATQSGGEISGDGTINFHKAFTWSGGNQAGAGISNFLAAVTITGNHTIQDTRTINNTASATFNGTSSHFINNLVGTTINNMAGATFSIDGNNDFAGTGTFNNAGTFTKSAGAAGDGITHFTGAFHNSGVVNINNGVLHLRGGGTQTGAYSVASGGTLAFAIGVFDINAGTTIEGDGETHFASNNVNFNTPTFDIDTLATQSGGNIVGDGTVNFNKEFTWSGGQQSGAGISNFNAAVTITGNHNVQGTRTLNNVVSATFNGTGAHFINNLIGTTINNLAGASFTVDGNNDFAGIGTFNNAGTFHKSAGAEGDGVTAFQGSFHNSGTVNVTSGELQLRGGGTQTGTFNVADGGVLSFAIAAFDINAGTTIEGEGETHFGSNNVNFNAPTFDIDTRATQTGGAILGEGTLNFNKEFTWSGGHQSGTGVSNFNAAVTITGNHNLQEGRTINNAQSATFNSTSNQFINNATGTTFNNLAGATFSIEGNSDFIGLGVFNNAGTFNKSAGDAGDGVTGFTGPFTNSGVINVTSGVLQLNGVFTNYDAGTDTITGGAYNVAGTLRFQNADINTNRASIKLDGPGSQIVSHTAADALTDLATNDTGAYFGVVGGRDFVTTAATFTNRGELELGGGTFSAPAVTNEASGEIFGFGTLAVRPTNSGTIRATGGTLTLPQGIQGGSGTIVVDPGATLNMSAASTGSSADTLQHNGAGLNLGANNLAISVDYNNANFGTGNSFNHRANVTGTGAINASPGVTQTLSGNVTGGNTPTATMAFGNVHVGDSPTRNYRINNVGGSGPSLRGALQPNVMGLGITDSRLTGTGVAATNFGPIPPGASTADYAVTFDATAAGPLNGQVLKIVNNFDNVGDQTLTITGAAYRYASPSAHTPEPVNFGIIHVGDNPSQALTVSNTAPNDGFSERLSASIGSPTGHATTNGGSIASLNPGATDPTSLTVGINTATAGMKTGTATISFTSLGTGTSGLPNTNLPSQVVNISAQVNNYADPVVVKVAGAGTLSSSSATSYTLDLGTFVQGQQVLAELGIKNDVAAPADTLAGMFNTAMAGAFDLSGFGAFTALAAGATREDLVIELDTSMVGTYMGSITLNPQSTNPRPFSLNLDPITIQLVAEVTLAGDYNDDGVVDARDYVVWRNNLNTSTSLPNDPTPGSVTAADYSVWKENYGAADGGSLFVSQAVPEPATLLLVSLGLAGLGLSRRKGIAPHI